MAYNGWTNYETWLIALWMDNNGLSEHFNTRAQEIYDECKDKDETTQKLAEEIEQHHEEQIEQNGVPNAGWIADLINAAMKEVNWHEIAEHYADEVEQEEQDDTEGA